MKKLITCLAVTILVLSPAGAAIAETGITELVSVSSTGEQGNGESTASFATPDGRYVAFDSLAGNLVPDDTNGVRDVFVRDRVTGKTVRVSVAATGRQGNLDSYNPSITPDGRYVVFCSDSGNLVPGDTNKVADVFVHDRDADNDGIFDEPGPRATSIRRVSISSRGMQGNDGSCGWPPSISADGRYVAFESYATNLVPVDVNGSWLDVFVHDRDADNDGIFDEPGAITTTLVSVSTTGEQGNKHSYVPSITPDGRYVVFESEATNLTPGLIGLMWNVFAHDRDADNDGIFDEPGAITTTLVDVSSTGEQGNSGGSIASISADGRYVAFESQSTNLVPVDANGNEFDIFVHDLVTGETKLVSISSSGEQGNKSSRDANISADGRYVTFVSASTNLVPDDTNERLDIFVHDRDADGNGVFDEPGGVATTRVSVSSTGEQSNGNSYAPYITPDGRYVTFMSAGTNLVPGDMNGYGDIFIRIRW